MAVTLDDLPPISEALIEYLEDRVKVLNFRPGGLEITPSDIAFVSGQNETLQHLRIARSQQQNRNEEQRGKPVQ